MSEQKKQIISVINKNGGSVLFRTLQERTPLIVEHRILLIRELQRDGLIRRDTYNENMEDDETIALTPEGHEALLPLYKRKAKLSNWLVWLVGISTIISAAIAFLSYFYPRI